MGHDAEPMPTTPRKYGAFLINAIDDWWLWNVHITGLARSLDVLDILLGKEPYPVEPTPPAYPGDAPANQTHQPGDDADNERRKPAPEQWAQYDREWARYERKQMQYDFKRESLRTIRQDITRTVHPLLLLLYTDRGTDNVAEIYQKLKKRLEPSLEDEILRVKARYSDLQDSKPTNHQSMERWLDEWDDVLSVCVRLKREEFTGWLGTLKFLTALKRVEPRYAEERLKVLREDHSLDVFDEIDDYRRRWKSKSQKQRIAILRDIKC